MLILNGRAFDDKGVGQTACKDNYVVDYVCKVSKAILLLWIFYFFLSCVCYAFVCVCLYVPCGHLLGKG